MPFLRRTTDGRWHIGAEDETAEPVDPEARVVAGSAADSGPVRR